MVDFLQIATITLPAFAILAGALWGSNKFLINRDEKELDFIQEKFFKEQIITIVSPAILNDLKRRLDLHFEFKRIRGDISKYKLNSFIALVLFVAISLIGALLSNDQAILLLFGYIAFIVALFFFVSLVNLIGQYKELNGIINEIKEIESSSVNLYDNDIPMKE